MLEDAHCMEVLAKPVNYHHLALIISGTYKFVLLEILLVCINVGKTFRLCQAGPDDAGLLKLNMLARARAPALLINLAYHMLSSRSLGCIDELDGGELFCGVKAVTRGVHSPACSVRSHLMLTTIRTLQVQRTWACIVLLAASLGNQAAPGKDQS
jgi:hypothetical protein